jgi:hypothetical protein
MRLGETATPYLGTGQPDIQVERERLTSAATHVGALTVVRL